MLAAMRRIYFSLSPSVLPDGLILIGTRSRLSCVHLKIRLLLHHSAQAVMVP
jgi:hypothetical protein